MQRQIDGPDWEWGDDVKVSAWFGIKLSAFEGMVRAGTFPPPTKFNKDHSLWHWRVVAAAAVLLPWLCEERVKPKGGKSSDDLGGT